MSDQWGFTYHGPTRRWNYFIGGYSQQTGRVGCLVQSMLVLWLILWMAEQTIMVSQQTKVWLLTCVVCTHLLLNRQNGWVQVVWEWTRSSRRIAEDKQAPSNEVTICCCRCGHSLMFMQMSTTGQRWCYVFPQQQPQTLVQLQKELPHKLGKHGTDLCRLCLHIYTCIYT